MADIVKDVTIKFTADTKDLEAASPAFDKVNKDINDKLKETGQSAVSLKTQLRQLKAELANATDPKDVERLARAAGEVANKIDDATKAAKIFSSESKFEQVGNAINGIGRNILSLNFKQAADESKLLASAVKSITFKESLEGVKDLGKSLLNVGRALLTNPLFLIGGAIAGIVLAYQKWNEAEDENKKIVLESNKEKLKSLKEFSDFEEQLAAASGAKDDEITKQKIANLQILTKENIAEQNRILENRDDLSDEEIKRLEELKDEEVKLGQQLQIALAAQQRKATESFLASEKKRIADKQKAEKEDQDLINKINKKNQDDESAALKKEGDRNYQIFQAQQAKREKDAEDEAALKKKLAKEVSAGEIKAQQEANDEAAKLYDEDLQKKKEAADKEKQLEEKRNEAEIELIKTATQGFFDYQSELAQRRQDEEDARAEEEKARIQALVDNKTITESEGAERIKAIDEKTATRKKEAAREQAKRDKAKALFDIAIDTAVNAVKAATDPILLALVLSLGAVEAALVAARPLPLAKGVIDLQGGVKGKDSIQAILMPGESVMTTEETARHKDLLKSIRNDKLDQYLAEKYVDPQVNMRLKDFSLANNMAQSIKLNADFPDEYALARVMQRNKKVEVGNADYLATKIAREISKSGKNIGLLNG